MKKMQWDIKTRFTGALFDAHPCTADNWPMQILPLGSLIVLGGQSHRKLPARFTQRPPAQGESRHSSMSVDTKHTQYSNSQPVLQHGNKDKQKTHHMQHIIRALKNKTSHKHLLLNINSFSLSQTHTHTLTHKCTHTLKIYYHRINKQLSSHLHLIKCYYLFKHTHTHTHTRFVVAYCILVIENIGISKDD